ALGLQAVGEQRQVDRRAGGAALQRVELVGEDGLAVQQQASDQRALAVVHAAGGEEAQCAVGGLLNDDGVDRRGARGVENCAHQKWPSFLRRSIEASEVLSSMRVAPRSLTVTVSVSATTSSGVIAWLSTGQVQVMSPTVRKRTCAVSTRSPGCAGVTSVSGTSRPLRRIT